jgi:hypothetical protein
MANAQIENEPLCHALLYFSGEEFDPDMLLPLIAMLPARVRRKGQEMVRSVAGSAPVVAKRGYCSFSTGHVTSSDINEHIASLLSLLEPHADQIKALVHDDNLDWGIVCFFDDLLNKNRWCLTDDNRDRAATLTIPVMNETISRTIHIVENVS